MQQLKIHEGISHIPSSKQKRKGRELYIVLFTGIVRISAVEHYI
jgi:hypothetical protein